MQIKILGSGPAIAIPRPGHRDKTCRDARKPGSRTRRMRSSMLIKYHGRHILIDAGPDILEQLRLAHLEYVDAIFLTHAHLDAAGGIEELMMLQRENKEKPFALYAEKQTLKKVQKSIAPLHINPPRLFKYVKPQIIKPFRSLSLFGLRIRPFLVEHAMTPGFPTLGFLIGKNFAYASDVAQIPPKSFKLLQGVKILVLDAAMWFKTKIPAHLNTAEAIAIGQKLGVKKLYLTQIGHGYPPHEVARREINKYCKKQKITFPVILAYDGLKVKI